MVVLEKKLRLNYIRFGLNEARKRLDQSLKKCDSIPICASLYEVVFWIDSNDTWHYFNSKKIGYVSKRSNDNGGKCTIGLRGVINSLKHDMNFSKLIRPEGSKKLFGIEEMQVEDYSTPIIWLNAKNLIDQGNSEQFNCYREYLEGKSITQTIDESILFLQQFNRVIK